MERPKGRQLRGQERRALVARFGASDLTVEAFCRAEGIGQSSFYRWRAVMAPDAGSVTRPRPAAPFVNLGLLSARNERFELRLELGGGIVLQLARG